MIYKLMTYNYYVLKPRFNTFLRKLEEPFLILKHNNYSFRGYCVDYGYSLFIIQITSDVNLRSRSPSLSASLPF